MNILIDKFPETVKVNEKEYPVETDFREWIRFVKLVEDEDAHIGDIVGGRDYLTGMYCARPIENVICCVMSGKMSKEYELEGENDNGDS